MSSLLTRLLPRLDEDRLDARELSLLERRPPVRDDLVVASPSVSASPVVDATHVDGSTGSSQDGRAFSKR